MSDNDNPNNGIYLLNYIDKEDLDSESKKLITSTSYQLKDKLMKQITAERVNYLFKRYDIPFVIEKVYPIELVYGNILRRLDFVGETINGEILNLEFQSTYVDKSDVKRFGEYALLLRVIYDKDVLSVILLDKYISNQNPLNFRINYQTYYKMFLYSLKSENGDDLRKNLLNKIESDKILSEQDAMDFVLCPLMNISSDISEFLHQQIKIIKKIKTSKENKEFIESITLLQIETFVPNEKKLNLLGELYMNVSIIDTIVNEAENNGIKKGELKGINKTNIRVAKEMIKDGYSNEEILKISKVSNAVLLNLLKT